MQPQVDASAGDVMLARFVSSAFIGTVCLSLVALVTLVTAVTLVENAGILANQASGGTTALLMALFAGIDYAYQILPIACFIGVLATGCLLAQRGELLAIETMGVGPVRVGMPMFVTTLLMVISAGACSESVMPKVAAERARLQRDNIRRVDALTQFYHRRNPWFFEGPWLLYLPSVDRVSRRFKNPVIYHIEAGVLSETIEAEALVYRSPNWWLYKARRERLQDAGMSLHDFLPLPLTIAPEDLIDVTGNPRELSSAALAQLTQRRARGGFDVVGHQMELQTRLSHPLSALVLVALALPWSLNPQPKRSLPGALGPGVAAIALYLFMVQVFRLLALAHKIKPELGAFGAVLVVLCLLPINLALHRQRRYRR